MLIAASLLLAVAVAAALGDDREQFRRLGAAIPRSAHFPPAKRSQEAQFPIGSGIHAGSSYRSGSRSGRGGDGPQQPRLHRAPLFQWQNLQYFTVMTLGSPPQSFRAYLDISEPNIIVTSSECRDHVLWAGLCNVGHFQYHGDWSKTAVPSNNVFTGAAGTFFWYEARESADTFSFAGIEVPNQQFLEAVITEPHPFLWWVNEFDGVLGFALDDANSPEGMKGPWGNMLEQGLVENGVVSMVLPRYGIEDGGEPGEIAFGGINEEMLEPGTTIRFLPISNRTDGPKSGYPYVNGTWQVEAQSVGFTWYNRTSGANLTMRHELPAATGTARFDTALHHLLLPGDVVEKLEEIARPRRQMFGYPTVSCDQRAELPDLVFELGGEIFILSPVDYILEGWGLGGCLWTIEATLPEPNPSADVIVLGSSFLRSVYTVFDRQKKNIGFIYIPARFIFNYGCLS